MKYGVDIEVKLDSHMRPGSKDVMIPIREIQDQKPSELSWTEWLARNCFIFKRPIKKCLDITNKHIFGLIRRISWARTSLTKSYLIKF